MGPLPAGAASFHAALFPADTNYLYFVAKPDRTHYFSKTLDEHNRAVRKYQLRR
ncbi:MAG: endolytic transglycosylase MltG [Desulfobacterales bacterium]